ncbi:hypothetical protein U27_01924 [Candidatus Vecturithrix granuli]|uniref:Uncharacterized protein n=1 Tax=Vecturithrix granuli TaxID=1499967 RepID=A0A0S6W652_VECG1|nr:hypothetical protein U27_01924 [Candidatus Vecturithrix granuli]
MLVIKSLFSGILLRFIPEIPLILHCRDKLCCNIYCGLHKFVIFLTTPPQSPSPKLGEGEGGEVFTNLCSLKYMLLSNATLS